MLSTLLLGFMSDYTQVGYYTSAIKISKLILPIVTSMSLVMVARINVLKGETNSQKQISDLLNRSFEYMMMLAVPATIGLMIIAPRFVPLFFGTEFIPATDSMQLLSLLILIIGLSNLFGIQALVGMGHEKKFLTAVLFGTVSNFCLNLLLLGRYGAFGASIASVVAEIIVTVATFIFAAKVIHFHINIKRIFQPITAALLIIPVSIFFDHIIKQDASYLFATSGTSGIIYAIVMVFIFKNEQANKVVHSIVKKLRNDERKI
jgi:O-antigen/teichoic acid export membrane protein